jgi:hypothetical protein
MAFVVVIILIRTADKGTVMYTYECHRPARGVPLLAFLLVFAHDSAEQVCGTTVTK